MERTELISFIKANDPFYTHAILTGYSEEQLRQLRERIIRQKGLKAAKRCSTCNGSGTVLNIVCASCIGTGTSSAGD
jgi:hypothetical protein